MAGPGSYRVKRISFQGNSVPILLQDVNGPCPLIAIANVLFLRSRLDLPAGVGEVSSVRGLAWGVVLVVGRGVAGLCDQPGAAMPGGPASPRHLPTAMIMAVMPLRRPHNECHADMPSQDKVVELLAEYFLDASCPEGRSGEEQAALQHQMADGMQLLPQLITGIDVNVRFNSIDGFEVS